MNAIHLSTNVHNENPVGNHRLALNEFVKGNFIEAKNILEKDYYKDKYNIYIASLMSEIHWANGEKNKSRDILKDILEIYPENNAITFQLLKYNIKDSIDLDQSVIRLNLMMSDNYNNPLAYKLLAEGYEKIQDKYNSKLALINFYNIKGNMPMAFRVIDDGLTSEELNNTQKSYLKSLRISILCEETRHLSQYLVIKPVIKKCFNKGHSYI